MGYSPVSWRRSRQRGGDCTMVPLAWAVLGIGLIGLEFLVPTYRIIWLGFGALVVALEVGVLPGLPWIGQLIVWSVATVAFIAVWEGWFLHRPRTEKGGEAGADLLTVAAVSPVGLVRFSDSVYVSKVWRVNSDVKLMRGDHVKLLGVEDGKLKVVRQ